jgi:hypothetical protein
MLQIRLFVARRADDKYASLSGVARGFLQLRQDGALLRRRFAVIPIGIRKQAEIYQIPMPFTGDPMADATWVPCPDRS